MAKDPICGMNVDERSPKTPRLESGGKTYYFCAESCRTEFKTTHPPA
ncbi:MAG: YHS domain-containing protein [Thermoplasmata archaeon]|nr:YHS domain-containing protein [Thermoplasmata archaeon]